jgi:hypothetical protein
VDWGGLDVRVWVKSFLDVKDMLLLDWSVDGLANTISVDLVEWYGVSIHTAEDVKRFADQLSNDLECMSYDKECIMNTFWILSKLISMGAVPASSPDGTNIMRCNKRKR